jgi:hypothetical protein
MLLDCRASNVVLLSHLSNVSSKTTVMSERLTYEFWRKVEELRSSGAMRPGLWTGSRLVSVQHTFAHHAS